MSFTVSKNLIHNGQYLHMKVLEFLIQKFLHLEIKSINLEINVGYLCLQAYRQVLNALFRLYPCRFKCPSMVNNITPWIVITNIDSWLCLVLWSCDIGSNLLFLFGVFKLEISVHWLLDFVCIDLFVLTFFFCACQHFIEFPLICSRSEFMFMRIVKTSLFNTMNTPLLIGIIQRLSMGSLSFVNYKISLFRPTATIQFFLWRTRKQCFLFKEADQTAIYVTH